MHFFQVPSDASGFVDLLVTIENLRAAASLSTKKPVGTDDSWMPPVAVNCSAGVGRSATLVACQIELDRLREQNLIDPQATVRRLRNQRVGAVQNYIQYTFICRVILEAAKRYGVQKGGGTRNPR